MRHSKLEKADILDLTVKYLQDLERRKLSIAMAVDPTVVDKFKSGYNECVEEVDNYLNTVPGVDSGMKKRIANHLKSYLKYQRFPQPGGNPFSGLFGRSTDEINNNGRLAMDGMPLIPSLLPSGELAFIMPHTAGNSLPFLPRFPTGGPGGPSLSSNHFKPIAPQEKQQYAPSPPLSPVSDQESVKDDLKTPLIKTRPTLMESLMNVFPTPPTPEESSRISAFRPNHKLIDRIRLHQEDTKTTPQRVSDAKRRKVEKEDDFSDSSDSEHEDEEENEAKENASGDMWRPW